MPTDPNAFTWGDETSEKEESGLTSAYNWVKGFGLSAAESLPELIGYTPSQETQKFRQDNPVSGFVSEMAGTAVPYFGWFKAAKAIGPLTKATERVASLVNNPIGQGALKEAATFAPFEAARVGISQTPLGGDKSFDDMLGGAMLNLAVGSGVGGLVSGLANVGDKTKALTKIFKGIDINVPYPLQAQEMEKIIQSGSIPAGDDLNAANRMLYETRRKARLETLPSLEKYVGPIAHDAEPDANTTQLERQLNALFKAPKEKLDTKVSLQVRKFAQGAEMDFPSQEAWKSVAKEAGLPQNFEQEGQYFRHISFNTELGDVADKSAQGINNRLTRNMTKVDDNSFITQEADDGMYIIAKKIAGSVNKPDSEDAWVLFKTDKPGKFFPDNQTWANAQVAGSKWTPGANVAQDGGEAYNALKNGMRDYPLNNIKAINRDPEGIAKLLPQGIRGIADRDAFQQFGQAWREYFAPRQYQFKKSMRANWIMGQVKLAYDAAERVVNSLMGGEIVAKPGANLFWASLRNDKTTSDLGFQAIKDVPEDVRKNWDTYFRDIVEARVDPATLQQMAASGQISNEARDYFTNVANVNNWVNANHTLAKNAVGKAPSEFAQNTYGLPRMWEGTTRIALRDENGKIVALASGPNRKAALANSEALKAKYGWEFDGEYDLAQLRGETNIPKWPKDIDSVVKKDSWELDRMGIHGYSWETKPLSLKEYLQGVQDDIRGKMKEQATDSVNDLLSPSLDRLLSEDPAAYRMVQARMNDYAGIQSPFSQWQNRLTDKVLAPYMGKNSASKIVQYTNTGLFNFQLGALRLAYPIVNLLQFVQTVVPEAAFIMGRAPPEALAGDYSHFAVGGTKGPVGGIAVLSPVKLMGKSMAEMARPTPELTHMFQRAANDRLINPRLVEEWVGTGATGVKDIAKVFTGGGKDFNFVEWLRSVSEALPAMSERMSRTHAFTTGYILGRDYLERGGKKLSEEQLYQFARQFTEKTMFLYSAADKPRVFTTPAGSLMGLFKNWMFNYMAQFGQYTHEGFAHNNWEPLFLQTAGTAALGGVAAVPMVGLADKAQQWFTHKSAMDMAYEQFGAGGDAVMLGLPAALTGISLYSNVNSPISNPTRDAASLLSIAAWDRVKNLSQLAGAAFDRWQATGDHPGFDPRVRQLLVRTFAPTTLYRTMGAFASPEQITQLSTGNPLIKDVSPAHQILYSMGFNPVELDRGMAISTELYEKKERMKGMVAKLGKAWSDAETRGDGGQMALIMRQAVVWGVDVSSVIKSGMRNLKKMREDIIERQLGSSKNLGAAAAALRVQRGQEETEE